MEKNFYGYGVHALWAGRVSAGLVNALLSSRLGVSGRLLSSSRSSSLSTALTSSSSSLRWFSLFSSSSNSGPGVEQRDTEGETGAEAVFCTLPNTIWAQTTQWLVGLKEGGEEGRLSHTFPPPKIGAVRKLLGWKSSFCPKYPNAVTEFTLLHGHPPPADCENFLSAAEKKF